MTYQENQGSSKAEVEREGAREREFKRVQRVQRVQKEVKRSEEKSRGPDGAGWQGTEHHVQKSFPVVVTSYEIVMNDCAFFRKFHWKYVVVDEGHRIKNLNCRLIRFVARNTLPPHPTSTAQPPCFTTHHISSSKPSVVLNLHLLSVWPWRFSAEGVHGTDKAVTGS